MYLFLIIPSCGIDRGISEALKISTTYDEFKHIELTLPKKCQEMRERVKLLQRRLRLKKKFSQKWKELQKKIRKLHSQLTCIRHDFLHKASTYIAKNHGYVRVED